jgi:hypothetical protein
VAVASAYSKDLLLTMYRKMYLMRRFEERTQQQYGLGKIAGFCHLSIGQEAVAVGINEAIQGAATFTHAVAGSGAHLVYVTGRHEAMRAGTEACMRQQGLPVPGEGRVHLLMKPHASDNDDAFKREAHARLGEWGTLIAAFDNEPTHANDYLRRFPQAQVIHLATDHSGRPVTLLEEIVSVPHFFHEP